MKYTVVSVRNEKEQSFPLAGLQILSNGIHTHPIGSITSRCCLGKGARSSPEGTVGRVRILLLALADQRGET